MFSFQQYCELHTYSCRSWFFIPLLIYNILTDEEKALVKAELIFEDTYKCWYPPESFMEKEIAKGLEIYEGIEKDIKKIEKKIDYRKALLKAIMDGDMLETGRLTTLIKEQSK